jgi:hypothetical protein
MTNKDEITIAASAAHLPLRLCVSVADLLWSKNDDGCN